MENLTEVSLLTLLLLSWLTYSIKESKNLKIFRIIGLQICVTASNVVHIWALESIAKVMIFISQPWWSERMDFWTPQKQRSIFWLKYAFTSSPPTCQQPDLTANCTPSHRCSPIQINKLWNRILQTVGSEYWSKISKYIYSSQYQPHTKVFSPCKVLK